MVLYCRVQRPTQHIIGHFGDDFTGQMTQPQLICYLLEPWRGGGKSNWWTLVVDRVWRCSDKRLGDIPITSASERLPARSQLHVVHPRSSRIHRSTHVHCVPTGEILPLPRRLRRDHRRIHRRPFARPVRLFRVGRKKLHTYACTGCKCKCTPSNA